MQEHQLLWEPDGPGPPVRLPGSTNYDRVGWVAVEQPTTRRGDPTDD